MTALEHIPAGAQLPAATGPKRSLILAGGGMRVAYQAGVIRALLEAGLTFAHADGPFRMTGFFWGFIGSGAPRAENGAARNRRIPSVRK